MRYFQSGMEASRSPPGQAPVNVCTGIVVAKGCWSSLGYALDIEIVLNQLGMFPGTSGVTFSGLGIVLEPFRGILEHLGYIVDVNHVAVAPMVPSKRPKALTANINALF